MTGAPGELVLAEHRGPVLVLTFNRPAKLNAWTDELEDRYFALLDAAEDDPDVRAVVVTGAGRGFCAGANLQRLQAIGEISEVSEADRARRRPRDIPRTLRKPLIGAINGVAAGLGMVEALYCDLRFGSPSARFTTAFAQRGLIAEYGISWLSLIHRGAAGPRICCCRVAWWMPRRPSVSDSSTTWSTPAAWWMPLWRTPPIWLGAAPRPPWPPSRAN